MILEVFSIRDAKAEIFNTPFFAKTTAEATRMFIRLVRDEKSNIHDFPEDYDLYFIGKYDDQTGKMEPRDTPQHLLKAVNVISFQKMENGLEILEQKVPQRGPA